MKLSKIYKTIIYGFFFTPLIYLLFSYHVGNIFFVFILFFLSISINKIKYNFFYLITFYMVFLVISLIVGFIYYDVPIKISLSHMLYYYKPLVFYLFGFFYIRNNVNFNKLTISILIFMIIGTIVSIYYYDFFAQKAIEKFLGNNSAANSLEESMGLLLAFSFIPRNITFLLSPLETSFVMFFITSYFYFNSKKLYFSISTIILISAFARSAMIAFIVSVFLRKFILMKQLNRFIYITIFISLILIIIIYFFEQFQFIFINDGSASIHIENLRDALLHISRYPLGLGLGNSGWNGSNSVYFLYSEGSFFTTLIENGIFFTLFYLLIGIDLYNKSKIFLFPIFIGYIVASLLIPIGFSTLFNLLFFSYYGVLSRERLRNG